LRRKSRKPVKRYDYVIEAMYGAGGLTEDYEMTRATFMPLYDHLTLSFLSMRITDEAVKLVRRAKLDPDDFRPDVHALDIFLSTPVEVFSQNTPRKDPSDMDQLYNGPRFLWDDGMREYCVASSVSIDSDDDLIFDMQLLQCGKRDKRWLVWNGGEWLEGPPKSIFEKLDIEHETTIRLENSNSTVEWYNDVSCLPLPRVIINRLVKAGYDTLDKIEEADDADLLSIRGIGKVTVLFIRRWLEGEVFK